MVKCYEVETGRYSGHLKGGRMGYDARKKSMGEIMMKPVIQFRKVFLSMRLCGEWVFISRSVLYLL